jgi:hypothetical protein
VADLEDRLRDMPHQQVAGVVPPAESADLARQVRRRRVQYQAPVLVSAATAAARPHPRQRNDWLKRSLEHKKSS